MRYQLTILPHELIYQAVAQLVGVQYVWAVLICFNAIVAKCFGPLEAAQPIAIVTTIDTMVDEGRMWRCQPATLPLEVIYEAVA